MGLFDRHAGLLDAYRDVRTTGADPFQIRMERVLSPTEAIINGKKTLLVGTNNYFGLTFDPSCMEAAIEAIRAEGTGTTGSRIANGSYSEHVALEKEIAEFYGKKHCMVFTTGYQANLGVISALVGPDDVLLIDADSHASIYDACKQTQAEVVRFKHNDPSSLDARLRRLSGRKNGDDTPGNRLVVLEGIYSMLGDSAPLKEFVAVCKKYNAYVLIDEAHSLGALGEHGRGLCEAAGVLDDCHFIVGTFSKTLGAIGGYCVSDDPDFDILRVTTRSYMFTASLPPSIVASVRQALRIVKAHPELRTKLWDNVAALYDGLAAQGFKLGPEHGPVVGVHLPDRMMAIGFWRAMLDAGIYVNVAVPPATPNGVSLLRCSVSAAHTREQIEQTIEVMTGIGRQLGVLGNVTKLRVVGGTR
ncbi:aminotransferase class I/II-fold pyridoxal phosphate-dependent enzyme [Enhydrobacter sp.]|jgi:8-amino-7-oxononanoate synthase|uniref:serine palmitoyltransferase n=1 Tax=Enhydrobacter sp. TaxID=1894999 RepID=UPI002621DCA0|nr:aminotransferase class I/II-fold pyridoxal phosphate-dependent enzyme [Enhydrobacter sp.]WIM10609.1 MAG: Serine palmitoyltransferase [Enhydrobacter sp.]